MASPKYIQPLRLSGGEVGCLLIHGFTSTPTDVHPLSRHLHSLGLSVHEVLLPGHGTSFQDMARYGWRDWLAAVETGLEELRRECAKVWLIGFSMGGMLAILAASRHQVEGLVCIAAPIWPRPRRTRYAWFLKYFQKYAQLGKRSDYKFPSWRYDQVALKSIADLMALIKEGKGALPGIQIPALIVQGRDDHTIEPRSAGYIYDHLGSRDKEAALVNGGHMLLLEPVSMDVGRLVSNFILIRSGGR